MDCTRKTLAMLRSKFRVDDHHIVSFILQASSIDQDCKSFDKYSLVGRRWDACSLSPDPQVKTMLRSTGLAEGSLAVQETLGFWMVEFLEVDLEYNLINLSHSSVSPPLQSFEWARTDWWSFLPTFILTGHAIDLLVLSQIHDSITRINNSNTPLD